MNDLTNEFGSRKLECTCAHTDGTCTLTHAYYTSVEACAHSACAWCINPVKMVRGSDLDPVDCEWGEPSLMG